MLKILKRLWNFFLKTVHNVTNRFYFKYFNVQIKSYKINGIIYIKNQGVLQIGANFKANSGKNYNPIGGDTVLRFIVGKKAKLKIGNNVGISNSTIFCTEKIIIEDNVLIGGGCKIWDTNFHSLNPKKRISDFDNDVKKGQIHIKKNAFIGGGTIILKGVTIGENSIVQAGSVVSCNIPDNEIWGGNPARFIRKLATE